MFYVTLKTGMHAYTVQMPDPIGLPGACIRVRAMAARAEIKEHGKIVPGSAEIAFAAGRAAPEGTWPVADWEVSIGYMP